MDFRTFRSGIATFALIAMGFVILFILLLLSFWFFRKNQLSTGISSGKMMIAWSIKIAFSFLFILIFTYFYGEGKLFGDAGNFFRDSAILAEYGKTHFVDYIKLLFGIGSNEPELLQTYLADTRIWSYGDNGDLINDNRLILKINSLIHFISFSNVYVHALIFSFISFLGIIHIYKAFQNFVQNKEFFFWTLVALPSIAFWGGGLTKESLMIFALGIFFYQLFKLLSEKLRPKRLLYIAIAISLLLFNKPYAGLIVLPLSLILISGYLVNWKKWLLGVWPGIIILSAIALSFAPSSINLIDKTSYKQHDLINIGEGGVFFITDSSFCAFDFKYNKNFKMVGRDSIQVIKTTEGKYKLFGQHEFFPFEIQASDKHYAWYLTMRPSNSYIPVTPVDYSGAQLIKNIPESLINTTIRPFPTDPGTALKYFVFLQNIALLIWLTFSIWRRKKLENNEKYILFYLFSSALITLLVIGWTTPILGAIVRYKVGVDLLLIIASFVLLKKLNPKRQ